jgi:hypothetical protein
LYEQQEKASEHTDTNVRQLLTLSSSLATLAIGLSTYLSSRWPAMAFLPLFASVYICVELLGVRVGSVPSLSSERGANPTWTRDLAKATRLNRAVHAYHVQLYRAALNWFLIAFLVALGAAALSLKRPPLRASGGRIDRHRAASVLQRTRRSTVIGPEPSRAMSPTPMNLSSSTPSVLGTATMPMMKGPPEPSNKPTTGR